MRCPSPYTRRNILAAVFGISPANTAAANSRAFLAAAPPGRCPPAGASAAPSAAPAPAAPPPPNRAGSADRGRGRVKRRSLTIVGFLFDQLFHAPACRLGSRSCRQVPLYAADSSILINGLERQRRSQSHDPETSAIGATIPCGWNDTLGRLLRFAT